MCSYSCVDKKHVVIRLTIYSRPRFGLRVMIRIFRLRDRARAVVRHEMVLVRFRLGPQGINVNQQQHVSSHVTKSA